MARAPRYEGSAADERNDRAQAKRHHMTLAAWERSAMDRDEDAKHQRAIDKAFHMKHPEHHYAHGRPRTE